MIELIIQLQFHFNGVLFSLIIFSFLSANFFYCTWLQVVAGELELNHECNLIHWSPEDFESKLQVRLYIFLSLVVWFIS